ncbi:MAG: hypothetical protein V3S01_06990 [Dehalococcoidia bacterium]
MSEIMSMSKLEAVNEMLYDIGERPVSTINGTARLDVIRAEATLDRVTREVCASGWWFNREERTLTVDGSGQYLVASNIVSIDEFEGLGTSQPVNATTGSPANFVVRTISGTRKLINTVDQVSTGYTDDLTVHVVVLLTFEQLPALVRHYIYAKASSDNALRAIGATELLTALQQKSGILLAQLKAEEISQQDFRTWNSPRHWQLNWNR